MIIKSDFIDYYDSSISVIGFDKTVIFPRVENTVKVPISKVNIEIPGYCVFKFKGEFKNLVSRVIGFCGKIYCVFTFNDKIYYGQEIFELIEQIEKDEIKYLELWSSKYYKGREKRKKLRKQFTSFVSQYHEKERLDLFRHLNCAYFLVLEYSSWAWNPIDVCIYPQLKQYRFGKIFPSNICYQEIEMFLSGFLGNKEPEMIEVSDKDKILQYGFDLKTSFRKDKQN